MNTASWLQSSVTNINWVQRNKNSGIRGTLQVRLTVSLLTTAGATAAHPIITHQTHWSLGVKHGPRQNQTNTEQNNTSSSRRRMKTCRRTNSQWGRLSALHTTRERVRCDCCCQERDAGQYEELQAKPHLNNLGLWCDCCHGNSGKEEVKLTGYVGIQLNLLCRQTSCPG